AVAAATALRGPGRALRRAVLLGLLLHDAGPRRERAPRPAARDGRQLRLADRLLRPRAERQSQLLPEPLAAAGVRADGGAVRGPRRERGGPLPAAAAPRACVLDGGKRRAGARRGAAPLRLHARRQRAQP